MVKSKSKIGTLGVKFFHHPNGFPVIVEFYYLASLRVEFLDLFLNIIEWPETSHYPDWLPIISVIYIWRNFRLFIANYPTFKADIGSLSVPRILEMRWLNSLFNREISNAHVDGITLAVVLTFRHFLSLFLYAYLLLWLTFSNYLMSLIFGMISFFKRGTVANGICEGLNLMSWNAWLSVSGCSCKFFTCCTDCFTLVSKDISSDISRMWSRAS